MVYNKIMTLYELDDYFNSILKKEDFAGDPSRNGIQIENSEPNEGQIRKVAFAVDASFETAIHAAVMGADALFVHHGLFWGDCKTITGVHGQRIATFIKNDLALIAYHIPLDANEEVGNNFGLARKLELEEIERFGQWRGMTLGAVGMLKRETPAQKIAEKLFPNGEFKLLDFGKEKVKKIGIISGGAGEDFEEALKIGCDMFITGEVGHELYHPIKESNITVLAGGHYQTETVGVSLMAERLKKDTGIETIFIDCPTGL